MRVRASQSRAFAGIGGTGGSSGNIISSATTRVTVEGLEDETQQTLSKGGARVFILTGQRDAVEPDIALGWIIESGEETQQRRLA